MKKILFIYIMLFAGVANAQDLFQKNIYSADRVMEMRQDLDLTESQALKIKKIHSENAGKFSAMKWDLDDETAKLKTLLDESKIDEAAVQKQMDKVLALENSLKKQQLSTMVSIKNQLSTVQQGILQSPRVQTVNGVSITGYGVNSVSPSKTVIGYPLIRVGTPNRSKVTNLPSSESGYVMKWNRDKAVAGRDSYSPNIKVQVENGKPETTPLYIISTSEGEKELANMENIKPEEIESLSVLKGNAATSKYGEKGKNGVIIIKLKDPKK